MQVGVSWDVCLRFCYVRIVHNGQQSLFLKRGMSVFMAALLVCSHSVMVCTSSPWAPSGLLLYNMSHHCPFLIAFPPPSYFHCLPINLSLNPLPRPSHDGSKSSLSNYPQKKWFECFLRHARNACYKLGLHQNSLMLWNCLWRLQLQLQGQTDGYIHKRAGRFTLTHIQMNRQAEGKTDLQTQNMSQMIKVQLIQCTFIIQMGSGCVFSVHTLSLFKFYQLSSLGRDERPLTYSMETLPDTIWICVCVNSWRWQERQAVTFDLYRRLAVENATADHAHVSSKMYVSAFSHCIRPLSPFSSFSFSKWQVFVYDISFSWLLLQYV